MKKLISKCNSENIIEKIIDYSESYGNKDYKTLKQEAVRGIISLLEILGRADDKFIKRKYNKSSAFKKKLPSKMLLKKIQKMRASNLRLFDISNELKKEGYNMNASAISGMLTAHRNSAKFRIPCSYTLGQAIVKLCGHGYTTKMIVERLNKQGYRIRPNENLNVEDINIYFKLKSYTSSHFRI